MNPWGQCKWLAWSSQFLAEAEDAETEDEDATSEQAQRGMQEISQIGAAEDGAAEDFNEIGHWNCERDHIDGQRHFAAGKHEARQAVLKAFDAMVLRSSQHLTPSSPLRSSIRPGAARSWRLCFVDRGLAADTMHASGQRLLAR
jgi:hypothetical protein